MQLHRMGDVLNETLLGLDVTVQEAMRDGPEPRSEKPSIALPGCSYPSIDASRRLFQTVFL